MARNLLWLIICFACLFPVAGCESGESALTDEGMISIEVKNNSDNVIISFALFFSDDLDEWGEDLLGDEAIEPGETYIFELPQSSYCLSLLTYEFYVLHNARHITEDTVIEIGGEGKVPILIENISESDVVVLYISPTASEDWGESRLIDLEIIPAEVGRRAFFVEPGSYDFWGLGWDGETIVEAYELEIKDIKRASVAATCPYWCPVLPEERIR